MEKEKTELVVIGGSAGSISAIVRIIPALKPGFSVPLILVLHRRHTSRGGFISDILRHKTSLQLKEAEEKEPIVPGTVYVAPADYHLLIESDRTFSLDASEKIHYSRPSIDVTFQSAAAHYGARLTGILLTGANADGAQGIAEIYRGGGHTIAQAPWEAEAIAMPQSAIDTGSIIQILTLAEITGYLNSL